MSSENKPENNLTDIIKLLMSELSRYTDQDKLNFYLKHVFETIAPMLKEISDKGTYIRSEGNVKADQPPTQFLQIKQLPFLLKLENTNLHAQVGYQGVIKGKFDYSSRQGTALNNFITRTNQLEIPNLKIAQRFSYDPLNDETNISYQLMPRVMAPYNKDKVQAKPGRPRTKEQR